ncbi:MAG: hypothetical protein ABI867_13110 [Kofleriaceae bacterium]
MASGARTVEAAPTRRPVTLTLRSTSTTEYSPLAGALRARVRPAVSATEMPAVWKSLRSAVYHQMPHHETKTFSLVAAPVVIDGAFDTVPGLGLAGAF